MERVISVQNKNSIEMNKRMYVKPVVTLHRVELEKSIGVDGSTPSGDSATNLTNWKENDPPLEEAHWGVDEPTGMYVNWN
jgi:hypothetical protein